MSDIIVKFKPQGDKELVAAINAIQAAQKNLTGSGKKYNVSVANMTAKLKAQGKTWKSLGVSMRTVGKAAQGGRVEFEKLNLAIRKTTKSSGGMLRNNRLVSNSLATVRSHLLLYQFALAMGIRQTINLAKQSSKVTDVKRAFENLSGGVENAALTMIKLRSATNGTMSDFDLLKQANNAMVLGVTKNSDEMSEMFDMAQRLGRALGVDTARSIESLVTGLGRQSVKMLDNIGIIVKSNDAYNDYAKANGLVASQLNDTQKRQAFFNAALTSGRKKMKELGPEVKSIQDIFDSFSATIDNLSVSFGNVIGPTMTTAIEELSDFMFQLSAGEWEKLSRDLTNSGIDITEYSSIVQSLNEELKKNQQAQAELMSGSFLDSWEQFSGSGENAKEILDELGFGLKTVTGTSQTLSRAFSSLWDIKSIGLANSATKLYNELTDDATLSVVDFNGANENSLLLLNKQIKLRRDNIVAGLKEIDNINKKTGLTEDARNAELTLSKATVTKNQKELEALNKLLPSLVTYLDLKNKPIKTEDPSGDFATELKVINQKTLLQEKLLRVQQDLETVMNKANIDAAEKKLSDDEALKLKEKEIRIKEQLIKLNQDEAAADLKTSLQKKKTTSQAFSALSDLVGMNEKYAKAAAAIQATGAVVDAFAAAQSTFAQTSKIAPPPFPQIAYAASLATGLVNARKVAMSANDVGSSGGGGGPQYEQGGYVGGRRHSQGGTIIEAEKGEFVMSRNAVQSIGLETLNQMNKGGGAGNININVSGNVLTQDFVEGELAESIKEAVRRGSDFGLS